MVEVSSNDSPEGPDASCSGFKALVQTVSPLEEPYLKSLLEKWDLYGKLQLQTLYYTKYYHKLQGRELIQDLFNDPEFQQQFQVATKTGGKQLSGHISDFKIVPVPATETRLDMFDRLLEAVPPIVRTTSGGDIMKCMDEQRDGFQVSDELRRLLVSDDSAHAELFRNEEKQQLLWRLFELVCLGGPCCQFEDQLQPYLEVTKRLYKSLLSVQKNSINGKVEVTSTVLEVKSCSFESGQQLFPSQARNNLCIVAIDPVKRMVRVLYHGFVPYW